MVYNGRILTGWLVEFVAPDLDAPLFGDYVVQWLVGDFIDTRMLMAEYTIGYASTQAFLYEPDKAPESVEMRLERKDGMGKTKAEEWFCWVSKEYKVDVCEEDSHDDCTDATWLPAEITCVCISGCGDDGDGGDGSDNVCPPKGCDTGSAGGGNDGDGEDDEKVTFNLTYPASVVRGATAGWCAEGGPALSPLGTKGR